jgi:hypothetical protein
MANLGHPAKAVIVCLILFNGKYPHVLQKITVSKIRGGPLDVSWFMTSMNYIITYLLLYHIYNNPQVIHQ